MKPIIKFIAITVVLSASRPSPASYGSSSTIPGLDTSTGSQNHQRQRRQPDVLWASGLPWEALPSRSEPSPPRLMQAALPLHSITKPTRVRPSLVTNLTDTGTHNAHGDEIYTPELRYNAPGRLTRTWS